jgi:hypothetical protein
VNDATTTSAPSARGGSEPCELPPPHNAGRLYKPAHPLLGILFLYVVAEGVLWGAVAGVSDAVSRLALASIGLCVFLVAATHWIENVDLRHAAVKLGLVRAGGRWWGVVLLVAAPAAVVIATESVDLGSGWQRGARAIVLACAALWQEIYYRGFVFRSLMGRHGFVASAAVPALLLALAVVLEEWAGSPLHRGRGFAIALLELPLGFGLCQLFWMCGQSVWPGVVVRIALLGALWLAHSLWPFALAAALLLAFGRFLFPRWQAQSP